MTVRVLETARLSLSKLTLGDSEFILDLVNEPAFKRFIGDRNVHTLDDAEKYLRTGAIDSYGTYGYGLYLVSRVDDGAPLGICGLVRRESLDAPDLGFAFRQQYWAKGYALESSFATIEHARNDLGLSYIAAIVDASNIRSVDLLLKLGFTYESTVRMPGESGDVRRYGLGL